MGCQHVCLAASTECCTDKKDHRGIVQSNIFILIYLFSHFLPCIDNGYLINLQSVFLFKGGSVHRLILILHDIFTLNSKCGKCFSSMGT